MAELVRGPLVIADLGGYTRFLTGTELDHAHDILADLLGVVAEALRPSIAVEKLEGDAVFCAGGSGTVPPDTVLSTIESCYASFARRRRTIDSLTTCACAACAAIPQLALKFVAHHGEWVERDIAGSRELVGTDVIRVHRLLKNSVAEDTGVGAYALLTNALLGVIGNAAEGLGTEHSERYEDCGEIGGRVVDLDARWREREASADIVVSPDQAALSFSATTRASPAQLWELITDPRHQRVWKVTATSVTMKDPEGARGVGSETHCVHGKTVIHQEIVDYKPPRHLTYDERNPLGGMRWSDVLEPLEGGGTRLTLSGQLLEGRLQRAKLVFARRVINREVGRSVDALIAYGDRVAAAPSSTVARHRIEITSAETADD
jgi:uncharacterized protein YndB with AHSA1/START domain